jgi:hypothetical protein
MYKTGLYFSEAFPKKFLYTKGVFFCNSLFPELACWKLILLHYVYYSSVRRGHYFLPKYYTSSVRRFKGIPSRELMRAESIIKGTVQRKLTGVQRDINRKVFLLH